MADPDTGPGTGADISDAGEASLPARLLQRLRGRFRTRNDSLRESLEEVIDEHRDESADFTPLERMMLDNLMRIGQLRLQDVMVPRADIVALDISASTDELIKCFSSSGHSRLPLYRGTLDDPVGMVHIRDLLRRWSADGMDKAPSFALSQIQRTLMFVPLSMRAVDLLRKMRETRIHMALVIDEYGGTDGLITIEDLIEEIVGEIRDEHDVDGPALTPRADGGFDADGRVEVIDLETATGMDLALDDTEYSSDTLGGLVTLLAGRVPQSGEVIRHPVGLEFEIVKSDASTVKRLRVRHAHPPLGEEIPEMVRK